MKKAILSAVLFILAVAGVILSRTGSENPHGKLKWDCQDCHTAESWSAMREPMKFNHDETGFHLAGAHAGAQCIGCHKTPQFNHVGTSCIDCHADHHQGQLGQDCQNCHTPRDWQGRKDLLDVHAKRGFPLTGAHAVADCEACHRGHSRQEYSGTPIDCIGCHAESFAATTDPNHMQAGFPADCGRCHRAVSGAWTNATYTHTLFALTGAHRPLDCKSCHANSYTGTSTACYDCHSANYAATTNPNHVQNGFSHNCAICHTTVSFSPASYNHNLTAFPLTGKHLTTLCTDCHATGYAGTPTDCYSCHQSNFQGAQNPDHVLANFSHTCATCHSTSGWSPATFNHSTTAFPLTGAHTTVACINCHATGYAGTPTACYACHQSNYSATTNPNHAAANFPTTCQNCHSTSNWTSTTWNHDAQYFPIYSGTHIGRWNLCADCHVNPANFATFECINCHPHSDQTTTDSKHSQVNGYQYASAACYTCHPKGRP
jgi:nitrate/TMAO reductase-like tetraheme cytochrome c subunit